MEHVDKLTLVEAASSRSCTILEVGAQTRVS